MSVGGLEFVQGVEKDGKEFLRSAVVGSIAFPSLLGTFQYAFRSLRVSCIGTFSSILGFASVSLASYGASWAALHLLRVMKDKKSVFPTLGSFVEPELIVSTIGGVLIFRSLGGKFKNVLPSHLLFPGAFAQICISANLTPAPTAARKTVQQLGRKYGCHSCGRKKAADFIADHQPPSAILKHVDNGELGKLKFPQQFYPQCPKCSVSQASACRRYLKGVRRDLKALVIHPTKLRIYHAFLPIPAGLVYGKELFQRTVTQKAVETNTEGSSEVAADESAKAGKKTVTSSASNGSMSDGGEKSGGHQDEKNRQTEVGTSDRASSVFPLLIIWQHLVELLESLPSPVAAFHLTVWMFSIIASWGTI